MALRGHTKIELTDVNTGEVEIYEDDNMVTNALNSFFWQKGFFVNNYLNNLDYRQNWYFRGFVLPQLTQGVLLFDQFIEEDPKNTTPPAGAIVVGRGSDMTYLDSDTTLGSYNINESGKLYNGYGYKHVWDFSTNQGNGEIKSVCLTTAEGGRVGVGNASAIPALANSDHNFQGTFENSLSFKGSAYGLDFNINSGEILQIKNTSDTNFFPKYLYIDNNTLNEKSIIKTGTIYFQKTKIPINEISIFDYNAGNSTSKIIEDDIPIYLKGFENIPFNGTESYRYYYFYYKIIRDEENIYFMFSYINYQYASNTYFEYNATPGDLLCYVWKINPRTLEVSDMITLRNSIGADIRLAGVIDSRNSNDPSHAIDNQQHYNNLLSTINIANDKAIIPYSSGSSYYSHVAIDLNDQSQVNFFKWIKDFGDETKGPAQWIGRFVEHSYAPLTLNNKIYIREYYRDTNNSSYVHDKEFDLTNYTVSWHAATTGAGFLTGNIKEVDNCLLYYFSDGQMHLKFFTTPLVTINNLPQIITKTTSQTMKVTYTIVDDEYAESIE